MAIKNATAVRNSMLDGITSYVGNAAKLRIYDGTRPANPQTAVTSQVLLAELTGPTPFAAGASGGVLTVGTITDDSSADATGTASWFRLFKSDGTTVVMDGDVGTSGSDLNLNTTSIVAGGPVQVTSYVLTAGDA